MHGTIGTIPTIIILVSIIITLLLVIRSIRSHPIQSGGYATVLAVAAIAVATVELGATIAVA